MAVDYGKENIRANTIVVGFVNTGTPVDDGDPRPTRSYSAAFEENVLVPRLGEPADIAAGVTYGSHPMNRNSSRGSQLTIDGGALCHQPVPELDFDDMRAESGREGS